LESVGTENSSGGGGDGGQNAGRSAAHSQNHLAQKIMPRPMIDAFYEKKAKNNC